ncbi:MAG: helix-turn-helix domain-containing protein [Odoribacter sp.]|nr:helix-turn-helix domain-containing protein [Odoribacter sp.]
MIAEGIDSKTSPRYFVGITDGSEWKPGHPFAVAGCLIMLCTHGSADITINSRTFNISDRKMAFIVFDMVAVPIRISKDFKAKYITLDYNTAQDIFFLVTSNRFWEYIYTTPIFALNNPQHDAACLWFSLLEWIKCNCSGITAETTFRNEAENFMLVMTEQEESHFGMLGINPPKNRAWVIVNDFLGLLNRYYTHHHNVAFYAEKLNITPNYLNIITKRNIGSTAKEQINLQLCLVTKMLLDTTDLTIKEIAEKLHYDDPSYLCRIFRKQTGLSPIKYRNKQRKISSLTDKSTSNI